MADADEDDLLEPTVELAFVAPASSSSSSSSSSSDVTRSKVGGQPVRSLSASSPSLRPPCAHGVGMGGRTAQVWLDCAALPRPEELACGVCGEPRALLVQVRRLNDPNALESQSIARDLLHPPPSLPLSVTCSLAPLPAAFVVTSLYSLLLLRPPSHRLRSSTPTRQIHPSAHRSSCAHGPYRCTRRTRSMRRAGTASSTCSRACDGPATPSRTNGAAQPAPRSCAPLAKTRSYADMPPARCARRRAYPQLCGAGLPSRQGRRLLRRQRPEATQRQRQRAATRYGRDPTAALPCTRPDRTAR